MRPSKIGFLFSKKNTIMKIFNLWEYTAVCQRHNRRGWFKHTATLVKNGRDIVEEKQLRVNRTWESYEYESVLFKVIDAALKLWIITNDEKEKMYADVKWYAR